MSPNNPSFVRLSDHMVGGCVVDMDSGWSLSGYDVQPFPEDKDQARFVRRKLNAGVCEPASQAEYDEAHPEDEDDGSDESDVAKLGDAIARGIKGGGGQQEHVLRQKEGARHASIKQVRAREKLREAGVDVEDDATDDDLAYAEEEARLQKLQEEQDEAGLHTDDPEEQAERTATRARKSTAKKATAGTRKRRD